jgi:hypothetical protein
MKGHNTLQLNEQTIIAAVQLYLESRFAAGKAPKVLSVKKGERESGGYRSQTETFTVEVQEVDGAEGMDHA